MSKKLIIELTWHRHKLLDPIVDYRFIKELRVCGARINWLCVSGTGSGDEFVWRVVCGAVLVAEHGLRVLFPLRAAENRIWLLLFLQFRDVAIPTTVSVTIRLGAYMQFLVERLLAESCALRREPLRLMGVRIHHDSCSNSRWAVVFYLNFPPTQLLSRTPVTVCPPAMTELIVFFFSGFTALP
jgi:hypothetical protein